jgi:hypothetical protein
MTGGKTSSNNNNMATNFEETVINWSALARMFPHPFDWFFSFLVWFFSLPSMTPM